jgi:exonuclease III
LKVATWNVNGIRARQAQFCDWLARDRPDVVCLQELKAEPGQIPSSARSRTTSPSGTACGRIRAFRFTSGKILG